MTNEEMISELCGMMGRALHAQGATQKDIDLLIEYIEELPYHLQTAYSQAVNNRVATDSANRNPTMLFNVLDGGRSDA